ncbi:RNA-binding protein 25-like [Ostrea edulis]|uniref:RNA-binding protein 25-like n=1 Tax=Ostrea edulis TaxID=37623 RepID=UPI0024AF6748|nr:RNA-binding protein 25-like [Ostrea edulis]
MADSFYGLQLGLSGFSAKSEGAVLKHVRGFRPHRLAEEKLKREGKEVKEPQSCICRNESPVVLGNRYTRRMTLKESQEVWKRTKGSTPNSEVGTDREEDKRSTPNSEVGTDREEDKRKHSQHEVGTDREEDKRSTPNSEVGTDREEDKRSTPNSEVGTDREEDKRSTPNSEVGTDREEDKRSTPNSEVGTDREEDKRSTPNSEVGTDREEDKRSTPNSEVGTDREEDKRSTPNSEVGTDREQEEAQVVPVSCPPVATTSWRRITHITSEDLLPEINANEEFNVLQQILNDEDILQSDEFTSRESSEETEGDHHYNLNCRSQTQPLSKTY